MPPIIIDKFPESNAHFKGNKEFVGKWRGPQKNCAPLYFSAVLYYIRLK
jgi:hypothetical protein